MHRFEKIIVQKYQTTKKADIFFILCFLFYCNFEIGLLTTIKFFFDVHDFVDYIWSKIIPIPAAEEKISDSLALVS